MVALYFQEHRLKYVAKLMKNAITEQQSHYHHIGYDECFMRVLDMVRGRVEVLEYVVYDKDDNAGIKLDNRSEGQGGVGENGDGVNNNGGLKMLIKGKSMGEKVVWLEIVFVLYQRA